MQTTEAANRHPLCAPLAPAATHCMRDISDAHAHDAAAVLHLKAQLVGGPLPAQCESRNKFTNTLHPGARVVRDAHTAVRRALHLRGGMPTRMQFKLAPRAAPPLPGATHNVSKETLQEAIARVTQAAARADQPLTVRELLLRAAEEDAAEQVWAPFAELLAK